jgi:AcrR family transcriptional regulator
MVMVLMVASSVLLSMNNDLKCEHCSCQVLVFSIVNVHTGAMPTASAPRTARERVREELTGEILSVAREQLARDGAAALSLRSIARDLGMAPSALYQYFDGRDALLSALILAAYESLAECAEAAADQAARTDASEAERFAEVPRRVRGWALGHPHEWGLIFGTPVPGYEAPDETVVPYARTAAAMVRPVVEAEAAGRLRRPEHRAPVSDDLAQAMAPITEGLLPGMPAEHVLLVAQAWTTVIGAVSLEVFGHWRRTILEPGLYFERTIADVARSLGLG